MYKKILDMSLVILTTAPTLKIAETTIKSQSKIVEKNSLFAGLDLIKKSANKIYQENSLVFDQVKSKETAFTLYQEILNNNKSKIQRAYEDKFESRWYWFGYWKWYATWLGFISTINDMIGAGVDAYDTWATIQPALHAALLTYLGTAGAVPVIGWIMGGAAAALATSILGAVAGHQLWNPPQRERGIVMSFYLFIYSGSWLQ